MKSANPTQANTKKGGAPVGGFRKESNLELAKLVDSKVRVKCLGLVYFLIHSVGIVCHFWICLVHQIGSLLFFFRRGRELVGTLRGYDDLVNLVVDDCDEFLRDENDLTRITNHKRNLGLVVIRGTQVSLVSPNDGTEEISNPFVAEGDD